MQPITNAGYDAARAARPEVTRRWLYWPEDAWTYAHHPHLAHFKGRFYAMWSNAPADEDAPGQRVLYTDSADFDDWRAPTPLVDTLPGKHTDQVLTPAGFHVHQGRLIAYVGAYEYEPDSLEAEGRRPRADASHMDTRLLAWHSADGAHWEGPVDLDLPLVPNHGPTPTASGRLIICGNVLHPWTDDPGGLSGWQRAGLHQPAVAAGTVDVSMTFRGVQQAAGWELPLCEGSFFQTDDGVLHMLHRSKGGPLWQSDSHDDGVTWSAPQPTPFSAENTKFHFGRFPDGRFYYVGSPDPGGGRCPLVLSTSTDGVHFDRHAILGDKSHPYERRFEGMHKGGDYGYPHTLLHDGMLYVVVSRRKEAVEVLRTPIPPA